MVKIFSVGIFLILAANLIKAQIFAGQYYRQLAQGNRIREVPIHAARGIIFDRNGTSLTANTPSFRLGKQEISKDQAIVLESQGKIAEIDSHRSYLFGSAFAHVLGYIDADRIGQSGVEQKYELKLRGINGKELVEVDALGKRLRTISTVPPKAGENLNLTLDAQIQKTVALSMEGKKGAVVVSNPKTGEILALFSSPSFDPNNVSDFLTISDQPLFNRAISGTYPPGSTYKIVTATASLETGAIKGATMFEDTGVLVIGPYKFPNWKWLRSGAVDGSINVVTALRNSNDIFFYKVGEVTGIDNLIAWSRKMGLGGRLGLDLPGEATGSVEKKAEWYLGDTYHFAIGQGDLLTTPLQVDHWTNIIAAGGKSCRPFLVGKPICRDLGIKSTTINLVREGMTQACLPGGTGYPLFGFTPQVACKTGTAEFGSQGKTHAWFTAFAPADKPEVSVTVLVEGGGEGSDVAAPIAKKILEKYFEK